MADILIAALSPAGHFSPLLAVAHALGGRGDHVTVLAAERHAATIRAHGAHPHPLPAGPTSTKPDCTA